MGGAQTLLINSLSKGGLQEHTENFLAYFMGEFPLIDRIDSGVKIIPLRYKGKFALPGMLRRIRKIIKENNISIVHTHLTPSDIYSRLVLPKNVKMVHTVHSTYSADYTVRRYNLILEKYLFFKKRDCNLIFLSDYNRNDFLRSVKFKGRTFVLNNFIADEYFGRKEPVYRTDATSLRMIAVGVLREEKNYTYLLEVLSFLKDYDISLDIYGGGDKTNYEKIVKEKQIKVRFMGQYDKLHTIFGNYDLFILPSKFEGFGLSIFEAMASGVPAMVSNLGSLRSILGEHAIYFDLDNAQMVAKKILAVYNHEIDVKRMAIEAKVYAEQVVKRETYIGKLLAIYDQVFFENKDGG